MKRSVSVTSRVSSMKLCARSRRGPRTWRRRRPSGATASASGLAHAMQPAREQALRRSAPMQHAPTLQREETMRWLNCLVVASLAAGSARAVRTWHQLEGSLAGRSTYTWGAAPAPDEHALGARHRLDPRLRARIGDELRRQLAARGYTATTADEARLLLSFSAGSRQATTRSGARARATKGSAAVAAPSFLAVHFFDPGSRVVLWRGWGDAVLSLHGEPDGQIPEAVRRIVAALPAAQPGAPTQAPCNVSNPRPRHRSSRTEGR